MSMKGVVKPESTLRAPEDLHSDMTFAGAKRRERWLQNLTLVFANEIHLQDFAPKGENGYLARHLVKRVIRWAKRTGYFEKLPTYKTLPGYRYTPEPKPPKDSLEVLKIMDRYARDMHFRRMVDELAANLYDLNQPFSRQDVIDALDLLGLPDSIDQRYHRKLLWFRRRELRRRVQHKHRPQKKQLTQENGAVDSTASVQQQPIKRVGL